MRKPLLATILVPFFISIASPARAASDVATIPASSNPGADDLQEWREAWQSLSAEDRKTLKDAWSTAADTLQSLTPEQRRELRAATRQLLKRLSAKVRDLDEAKLQALQEAFQRWVEAYRALDAADKQAALEKLAAGIGSLESASTEAKAKLQALADALR